jgi:5'-3' exonuclease
MSQNNNVIIVDGNSIGRTAHRYQKRVIHGNFEIQAINGFLEVLTNTYNSHHNEYPNIIVLWDGKSKLRNELLPSYKGTRHITPEDIEIDKHYHLQMPYIENILNSLGVRQYKASDFEADDLAGYFVRRAAKDGRKVLLISNDHDWLQYINENTAVFSPKGANKVIKNHLNFSEYIDLTPRQFIEYKALLGDDSDNIKGIPGIGTKISVALLQEFKSVKDMIKIHNTDEFTNIIQHNVLLKKYIKSVSALCTTNELIEKFDLNVKLMDLLRPDYDAEMASNIKYTTPKVSKEDFINIMNEVNLTYNISNISRWNSFFNKDNIQPSNENRNTSNRPKMRM